MEQYLHNLKKKKKTIIKKFFFLSSFIINRKTKKTRNSSLPIVVNEIINNHVESSIDICPVLTLKSHARIHQLAIKNVVIQNVVKQSAGRC